MLDKNTIKKELYKQKPTAEFSYIRMGVAYYHTEIRGESIQSFRINFEVPVTDMGNADFERSMDAKLLNRWIVINPTD